jgi:hypothetical protein
MIMDDDLDGPWWPCPFCERPPSKKSALVDHLLYVHFEQMHNKNRMVVLTPLIPPPVYVIQEPP